jgi:hypothetical protein
MGQLLGEHRPHQRKSHNKYADKGHMDVIAHEFDRPNAGVQVLASDGSGHYRGRTREETMSALDNMTAALL